MVSPDREWLHRWEADLGRSLDWETVQSEKRQFVPVAPLKGNATVSDGEEAAPSQAQGVAPFEDCDIAGFVMISGMQVISAVAKSRSNISQIAARPSTGSRVT